MILLKHSAEFVSCTIWSATIGVVGGIGLFFVYQVVVWVERTW